MMCFFLLMKWNQLRHCKMVGCAKLICFNFIFSSFSPDCHFVQWMKTICTMLVGHGEISVK